MYSVTIMDSKSKHGYQKIERSERGKVVFTGYNVIEVNNVSHYFSSKNGELQVLDNLSFSVPKNGFSAIVGPSGCGKSTVTKLIAGLMKPRKGSIILNGEAVQSPRSNIGMAFQNPVLLEWRNILKNVMLPLEIVHNKLSNEEKSQHIIGLMHNYCNSLMIIMKELQNINMG